MDLVNALTRSGEVPLFHIQLHIVIASTNYFDETVMHTVLHETMNPIEQLEQVSLIVISTITNEAPSNLIEFGKFNKNSLQEQASMIMQSLGELELALFSCFSSLFFLFLLRGRDGQCEKQ